MSAPPPRTPAECFAGIIRCLVMTLDGHSTWGRLARPLALLIFDRLRIINQRFRRIADRVAAGTYVPRRTGTRRPPAAPKPRRPDPLPQGFAWLLKLVQETAVYGSQLEYLFRDPEMVALMAAAPAPLRRPLRSLCRMLGATPPPILAAAKPRPRRETAAPATPEAEPPVAPRREAVCIPATERPAPAPRPTAPPSLIPRACGPPLLPA